MSQNSANSLISTLITLILILGFAGYSLVNLEIVSGTTLVVWLFLLLVIILLLSGLKIVDQYERGVVLTLGKYTSTRQPGLTWVLIGVQRMIKIDMRITTIDIPQQEAITKDNVPVGVNAVVYFNIESAENAILNIQDYTIAVS
ncbi:MAG TPA: SPFH domain-containing protein, partial [Patescibacteria group bacterium]|nr:SPFH domain-containing protein [Patescibacteria group bacterium]